MFGHMHTARPQEERASRRTQKEQKRLASSSHIDSATSSPVPAHSRLSAAARASHLRPSSSKHSTLSRQLSLHQQRNHASPADSTVDSVGPGLSCTNDTLGHDETMGQHEPRSAFRSGLDKVHHFFAPSKSKPVRASARTKAEALQGVPSAGSPLRRGSEVRRPSRRGSSLSKTPAGTVSPGESINTPPQVVDLPPPWTSAHVDENMPPQYQNMDFSVYGGSAARAAANNANKMRLGRRDSQTSVEEQQGYAKGNRESGVDMAQEYNGAMDHLSRRVSVVKPRDPVMLLPYEITAQIFAELDGQDLRNASKVSLPWRGTSRDQHVWRQAFQKSWEPPKRLNDLPLAVGGKGTGMPDQFKQDWSKMYQARQQIEQNWKVGRAVGTYLNGHTDSVYCTQFDEKHIYTGSRDRTIRIWDMKTHKCLRVIGIPTALQNDRTHRATPNPNCTLPTLSDTSKMKCNPNDPGEPDPSIYHTPRVFHDASILCLQLDDEIAITGSSDSTLLVWDVKTWEPIRRLVKHTAGVLDVAFDNEKIVSCSKDSTLCIWDRATGRLLEQIAAHRGPVNAVQLRGQLVVSASGEGCARLWNLNYISRINPFTQQHEARAKAVQVQEFWSKERGLACIEFSDDGACVLAGGNDMQIFKYDARSGQLLKEMKAHSNLVRSLYLDEASGRIISGSYDSVIRVWDLDSGKMKGEIAGWTGSWMLSAKSDFRRIVATSQDSRALVLDFGAGVDGVEALEEGGSV